MAKAKDQLPALLTEYAIAEADPRMMAEVMKENVGDGGITRFDLDKISVPAGGGQVWTVPTLDGPQPLKELTGVIVYFADQRAYWDRPFGDGAVEPPKCTSVDAVTGQGDPGGDCASCPLAQFGTAIKQGGAAGRGQACRLVRVMFMLLPNQVLPYVVPVPPGSYKEVKRYFLRLASQGVVYHSVLTRLKLQKAQSQDGIAYAQILPEFGGRLTAEDMQRIAPLKDMLRGQMMTVDSTNFAD